MVVEFVIDVLNCMLLAASIPAVNLVPMLTELVFDHPVVVEVVLPCDRLIVRLPLFTGSVG